MTRFDLNQLRRRAGRSAALLLGMLEAGKLGPAAGGGSRPSSREEALAAHLEVLEGARRRLRHLIRLIQRASNVAWFACA
jgi:hypothetical protein